MSIRDHRSLRLVGVLASIPLAYGSSDEIQITLPFGILPLEQNKILIDKVITMIRSDAASSSQFAAVAASIIAGLEKFQDTENSSDVIDSAQQGIPDVDRLQSVYGLSSRETAIAYQYLVIAYKAVNPVVRRFPRGFKPNSEEWRQIEDNLFERIRRRFPAGFEPDATEWRQIRDNLYEKIR